MIEDASKTRIKDTLNFKLLSLEDDASTFIPSQKYVFKMLATGALASFMVGMGSQNIDVGIKDIHCKDIHCKETKSIACLNNLGTTINKIDDDLSTNCIEEGEMENIVMEKILDSLKIIGSLESDIKNINKELDKINKRLDDTVTKSYMKKIISISGSIITVIITVIFYCITYPSVIIEICKHLIKWLSK